LPLIPADRTRQRAFARRAVAAVQCAYRRRAIETAIEARFAARGVQHG
jgi:hypothetical protein